jgi:hypothetical protein
MKVFNIYALINILPFVMSKLVNTKKLCRDCKHFIANDRECGKYGITNIITGKESYDDAKSVRYDKNKCGEDAKDFEKNHFKIITVPYYLLKDYWMITPVFGLAIFYIYKLYEFMYHSSL